MSILLNDEALCCGARRLAVQLAAALPAPEDGFSPAFQADMTALTRCVTRRQAVRRWGRRAAAAAGGTVQDYTPTAPLGYVLSGDFTGRENGIRVMRWTSSQGDLLFEAVPMTGDEPISVELRSNSTGGLSSTETGQRPTGGAGEPEDYETENVTVHGLSARLYRILPAKGASPQVQHGCGLWFYRGSDPVHFHQVSIPEGAAALVWVDERANCLFLLIGGQSRQELVSTAESMYESERS